jgi:hypothetical protein
LPGLLADLIKKRGTLKKHALEFSRDERAILLALLAFYRSQERESAEDTKYRDNLKNNLEQFLSLSVLDIHILRMALQSTYDDLNKSLK